MARLLPAPRAPHAPAALVLGERAGPPALDGRAGARGGWVEGGRPSPGLMWQEALHLRRWAQGLFCSCHTGRRSSTYSKALEGPYYNNLPAGSPVDMCRRAACAGCSSGAVRRWRTRQG